MTSSGDSNDSLFIEVDSITEGAGLFLGGNLFSQGIDFVKTILLTQFLGASLYGIFAYVVTLFSVVRVLTRLGSDSAILRFLPEFEDKHHKQRRFVTLAYATGLFASIIVAAALFITAPIISHYTLDNPLFVDILKITAIVLPFSTTSEISCAIFKSINKQIYDVCISSIIKPIFRLLFTSIALILGLSLYGVAAAFVVAGILTFISSIVIIWEKTHFQYPVIPTLNETRKYYDYSIPLTFNQFGGFLYNRADLLMVGIFLSEQVVGIYKISVVLSGFLLLPLAGFNQLFPPIASQLYQEGKTDRLETIYSHISRLILIFTLFPAAVIFVFPADILVIFGKEFTRGSTVVAVFVIAQMANIVVGPSGYVLMMTDHQYLTSVNTLASGMLNIVLNYVLILKFGFIGAAVATASVLSFVNIARVIEVWYLEGISPYNGAYLTALLSGIGSGLSMYSISLIVPSRYAMIAGIITGATVYGVLLSTIGLQDKDRQLLKGILSRIDTELSFSLR
ncbi:flippase [Haloarcula amylovorans]|uniref:flippase n=1 Tax=Haloarcula amylovorans TaxID=2562280 RepID=UPI001075E249|nr:flippase [Halomicroarcula amylolytica]